MSPEKWVGSLIMSNTTVKYRHPMLKNLGYTGSEIFKFSDHETKEHVITAARLFALLKTLQLIGVCSPIGGGSRMRIWNALLHVLN